MYAHILKMELVMFVLKHCHLFYFAKFMLLLFRKCVGTYTHTLQLELVMIDQKYWHLFYSAELSLLLLLLSLSELLTNHLVFSNKIENRSFCLFTVFVPNSYDLTQKTTCGDLQ